MPFYVARLDLINPFYSGNKYFKLKYNFTEAKKQELDTVLTFGGAYSNHIYATAAYAKKVGLKSIGVIRGEELSPVNTTLLEAQKNGMIFHFVDRAIYRNKNSDELINSLKNQFGDFYLIPEGGSNALAIIGCQEIIKNLDFEYDTICTPCGSGGTIAGLITGLNGKKKVLGFPVLKGGDFLKKDIQQLICSYYQLANKQDKTFENWDLITDYHFGGYAKSNADLLSFIEDFTRIYHIPIEPVYTGKMFFGLFDMLQKGLISPSQKILILHTGGLRWINNQWHLPTGEPVFN